MGLLVILSGLVLYRFGQAIQARWRDWRGGGRALDAALLSENDGGFGGKE